MSNAWTQEELDCLSTVHPTAKGYGVPGAITKKLEASGLIDLVFSDTGVWHALRTKAGDRLLKEHGYFHQG